MEGAELAGEVSTSETYVVPAVGERRFTVAALDLGIKSEHPADDGRAGHRGARDAGALQRRRGARGPARRRVLLQRARRPGGDHATRSTLLRSLLEPGRALLRDLLRQPALRPRTRLRHLQAEVRPPRHQPAGDGPHHRQGRGDRAQPRLRRARRRSTGATRTEFGEATVSHVCLNDDVVEGLELRGPDGRLTAFSVQYHPEAAAGPHDAAYLFDRFCQVMEGKA